MMFYPPSQNARPGRTGMNAKKVSAKVSSKDEYTSAGFAEVVKMLCAKAQGASLFLVLFYQIQSLTV